MAPGGCPSGPSLGRWTACWFPAGLEGPISGARGAGCPAPELEPVESTNLEPKQKCLLLPRHAADVSGKRPRVWIIKIDHLHVYNRITCVMEVWPRPFFKWDKHQTRD